MAYTTEILQGNKAFALVATKGKFFYGTSYKYFTETTAKKDEELGKVEGGETVDKVYMVMVATESGTVYFPAADLYIKDDFGTRLELDSTGNKWSQVNAGDTKTDDTETTDKTTNLPTDKGTGILGGIKDVIVSAGDLLKGTKGTTPTDTANAKTKKNTTLIILGVVGILAIGIGIYFVSRKPKVVTLPSQQPQPVPSPAMSGLKNKK